MKKAEKMSIGEKIEFLKALEQTIAFIDSQIDWLMEREYDEDGMMISKHIPTIEENKESHYCCNAFIRLREELENLAD